MRKKIKLLSVILCVLALTGCNKSSQNELTISVATSLLNPINEIIKEYENENKLSDLSAQKLIVMCNPKYLGNYYIREFDDLYKWWNFLAEIVSGIR